MKTALIAYLQGLIKKPWFITFRSLLIGALVTQLQAAYQAGHIDMSMQALSHMLVGSVIAAGIALWHLYLTPPNSGIPAAEKENGNESANSGKSSA